MTEKFTHLGATYYVRKSANGNVVLKSANGKLTLRPEIVKALIKWLKNNDL